MTNITNRTTVKQLIEMGVNFEQIEALIVKANKSKSKAQANLEHQKFIEEVYSLMVENPESKWKNGDLLKTWFPEGKSKDAEVEKSRVSKHSEISKALQALTADGRIVKCNETNTASGTFYMIAPLEVVDEQPESNENIEE